MKTFRNNALAHKQSIHNLLNTLRHIGIAKIKFSKILSIIELRLPLQPSFFVQDHYH